VSSRAYLFLFIFVFEIVVLASFCVGYFVFNTLLHKYESICCTPFAIYYFCKYVCFVNAYGLSILEDMDTLSVYLPTTEIVPTLFILFHFYPDADVRILIRRRKIAA